MTVCLFMLNRQALYKIMAEILEIPSGWTLVRLGEIFNFVGGGTPSKKNPDYWNGDVNWASVKDIKYRYLFNTEDTISESGLQNSSANIAIPGDVILITRINPGKSAITKIRTAINQDLKIIKPKYDALPEFVQYLFSSIEKKCIALSCGTTVLGISLFNLNEFELLFPPLPEQHRIVAKIEELFSSLDKGMESLKTAQQQLKVYRQAVLKWAFEGKLTNENVKDGELPKGWKWSNFENVCRKIGDVDHKMPNHIDKGDFPYLSTKDFTDDLKLSFHSAKYISTADFLRLSRKVKPERGDIIFPRYGTIGKNILVETDREFLVSYSCAVIKPDNEMIDSKYLYYFSLSPLVKKEIIKYTVETTQANIGIESIKRFVLPLPGRIIEQRQIVSEIDTRLSVCDKLEETITQSLRQAEALRQSILKKAFEGKLVPQDPSDEPASVLLEKIKPERGNLPSSSTKKKANGKHD